MIWCVDVMVVILKFKSQCSIDNSNHCCDIGYLITIQLGESHVLLVVRYELCVRSGCIVGSLARYAVQLLHVNRTLAPCVSTLGHQDEMN